jgi:hypothetical protein
MTTDDDDNKRKMASAVASPPAPDVMAEYAEMVKERRLKSLDECLPITSSRTSKWYYSAFHNVMAMVGTGVLGLPFAMS